MRRQSNHRQNITCHELVKQEDVQAAVGVIAVETFSWQGETLKDLSGIAYDKETQTICISERKLMALITLINPAQQPRNLKLVPDVCWNRVVDVEKDSVKDPLASLNRTECRAGLSNFLTSEKETLYVEDLVQQMYEKHTLYGDEMPMVTLPPSEEEVFKTKQAIMQGRKKR